MCIYHTPYCYRSVCMIPLTLAVFPISLECVSSGADAAVRAWQVDTLPLTALLLALIYICVWTQPGSSDIWHKLEKSTDFFSPTYTLLLKSLCGWILRCCCLLFPVPGWTLSDAAVSVSSQDVPVRAGALVGSWCVVAQLHTWPKPLINSTLIYIWIRKGSLEEVDNQASVCTFPVLFIYSILLSYYQKSKGPVTKFTDRKTHFLVLAGLVLLFQ